MTHTRPRSGIFANGQGEGYIHRVVDMLIMTVLCLSALAAQAQATGEYEDVESFTNVWAVHLNSDEPSRASEIAARHGFTSKGRIADLPGYFKFVHNTMNARQENGADSITARLQEHPEIHWVEQQRILVRTKRDLLPMNGDSISRKTREELGKGLFNDKDWPEQWYLLNYGQLGTPLGNDINVVPVWQRGYRGQGMVLSIVDDGVDHTHPELKDNYDPVASFDFIDNDSDPFPNVTNEVNAHGTECAGEVAAKANNTLCGVGITPKVNLGAIRFLDNTVTDQREAESLSFQRQYIDVYSNSWGPADTGKVFSKPKRLTALALEKGAKEGRGGKGNIFVWASGNGGLIDDNCNADGYTSSIYTISIASVSSYGLSVTYGEKCASTAAAIYTSGSHVSVTDRKPLVTTSLHHKCTTYFSGTSSATPLAAGVMALVLQANPQLTWRDVQHLIVHTAKMTSELDDGWKENAAGIKFNHKFGFGLLDAGAMVDTALNWTNVADQRVCEIQGPRPEESEIPSQGQVVLKLATDACKGTPNFIQKLEHVQVVLSLEHRQRGDLTIDVTSPSGTRNVLLTRRPKDTSTKGLKNWPFTTLHLWGENPAGEWTVVVRDTHDMVEEKKVDMEDVEQLIIQEEVLAQKSLEFPRPTRQTGSSEDDDGKLAKARKAYGDLHYGRFKGDYMDELDDDASETWGQGFSVAGRVLEPWKVVLYGTA